MAEIVGQIWRVSQFLGFQKETGERPITNVVMMGMGEPLLNLANVIPAMDIMLDDFGFSLSKRRVTLSTSGVVPALDKLGDALDVALAVSIHAPNDELRDVLVPVNKKYPLEEFLAGIRRYLAKSNANRGRVTVEYVMLDHINDSTDQAHELAKLMKDTPCKINLIPFNPYPGSPYGRSSNSRIDRFSKVLMEYGLTVIVRKTRGDDIDAACGQLAGDIRDRTKRSCEKTHARECYFGHNGLTHCLYRLIGVKIMHGLPKLLMIATLSLPLVGCVTERTYTGTDIPVSERTLDKHLCCKRKNAIRPNLP